MVCAVVALYSASINQDKVILLEKGSMYLI